MKNLSQFLAENNCTHEECHDLMDFLELIRLRPILAKVKMILERTEKMKAEL